jgi:hypothetical protein
MKENNYLNTKRSVTVGTGKQTPTVGRRTIELDHRLGDNTDKIGGRILRVIGSKN